MTDRNQVHFTEEQYVQFPVLSQFGYVVSMPTALRSLCYAYECAALAVLSADGGDTGPYTRSALDKLADSYRRATDAWAWSKQQGAE